MTRTASTIAPDRSSAPAWLAPLVALLVALQLWSALSSAYMPGSGRALGVDLAALACAALAVFGLRSVPLRRIVWTFTLVSGVVLARFGLVDSSAGVLGAWRVFLWLAAATTAMVVLPGAAAAARPAGTVLAFRGSRSRIGLSVLLTTVVAGTALLIGPRLAPALPTGTTVGEAADRRDTFPSNPLDASDQLDMTRRPRLSDRVVMTVKSPVASFWRTEVYDTWSGSTWTRSYADQGLLVGDGRLLPSPDDLAATEGRPFEQEFRIEVGFTTALPAAPSAVEVDTDRAIGQRPDGTMVTVDRAMGRGSTYKVISRQAPTSFPELRTLGAAEVPRAVLDQYAEPPVATARTVRLARELTEGLDSNLDKVQAITAWMDENTGYSLDAPLAPSGVDVVDDFLFESQLGWCEQIASSLVVMARSSGVPARLAAGFVSGQWDEVSQRFVVREREAHAWAEVWFPQVGWVPFDPTASVPLAGSDDALLGASTSGTVDAVAILLLAVAVVFAVGPPLSRGVRAASERVSSRVRRRRLERDHWDIAEEVAIETEVNALVGRPRRVAETLPDYVGAAVGLGAGSELVERTERVEVWRYGPPAS